MRVALYVRVSTEEQKLHGLSVDNQIEALTEYAKENNHIIAGVYNDAGISARKSYKKRPALLDLLNDCKAKKIDLIIFTKLDRWFRSVADYYEVQRVLDECKVPWRTIWEDYETETSSGVFKVNIMLSVAQSEADRTSERIKKVFEYKRERGEALTGRASVGYIYREGKWYKDPDTQKGIEAFFETYLNTFNKKLAITRARELGTHISDETARFILYGNNYHGVIPYITEAYITQDQHDLILANKPNCSRNNKYYYIFSGLVRCGKCHHSLSASTSIKYNNDGSQTKSPMYLCDYGRRNYNCAGTAISEKKLEKLLLDTIETELDAYNIKITLDTKNDNADRLQKNKEKLNRIKILFELGDIDVDEYKTKRSMLLDEISKLETFEVKKPVHLDPYWKDLYNSLDATHKNSFWRQIIDSIEVPERKATEIKITFK